MPKDQLGNGPVAASQFQPFFTRIIHLQQQLGNKDCRTIFVHQGNNFRHLHFLQEASKVAIYLCWAQAAKQAWWLDQGLD